LAKELLQVTHLKQKTALPPTWGTFPCAKMLTVTLHQSSVLDSSSQSGVVVVDSGVKEMSPFLTWMDCPSLSSKDFSWVCVSM
jgi:hypothetical protein